MTYATPNQIRQRCQEYGSFPTPTEFPHSKKGPIISALNEVLEGNSNRYIVFGWLFTNDENVMELKQTADLTTQQWNGLKQWYGAKNVASPDESAVWFPREEWSVEARQVLTRATSHWDMTHNTCEGNDGVPLGHFVRLPRDDEPLEPVPPPLPLEPVVEVITEKYVSQEIELVF